VTETSLASHTTPPSVDAIAAEELSAAPDNPLRNFWRQFSRNKGALLGLAITLLMIVVAVAAPKIAPYPYDKQDFSVFLQPPGPDHWMGTDEFGRDVLSRIIYGSQASMATAVVATGISFVIGISLGTIGGYFGGFVDRAVGAIVDISWSFPYLLLALFLVAFLKPGLTSVMLAIGLVSWAGYARVVRAQILSLKTQDFITAAKIVGASDLRIMLLHLLPNAIPSAIVLASLGMAYAILVEAGLSYLGLGIQPPMPSWGSVLSAGRSYISIAPWLMTFPGLTIAVSVLGFNLLGDGLRDALDPRLRQ
jgi:peptide/nickel transport system permease protein